MIRLKRSVSAVVLGAVILMGCTGQDPNMARLDARVQTISVGEPYAISAQKLASVMLQAGFTGKEILEHGPDVRNALGTGGGAQVNKDRFVQAILTVQDGSLYVSSRDAGTFMHKL